MSEWATMNKEAFLIRIRDAKGNTWFAHTAAGLLCEYDTRATALAQITRLKRKASAGRTASETFELYPIYY
jgi:hypothetical protein